MDEDQSVDVQVLKTVLDLVPGPTTHSRPQSKPKSGCIVIGSKFKTGQDLKRDKGK